MSISPEESVYRRNIADLSAEEMDNALFNALEQSVQSPFTQQTVSINDRDEMVLMQSGSVLPTARWVQPTEEEFQDIWAL